MGFDGGKKLAYICTRGDQFREAVQLLTARFAVNVAVLVFVKYCFYQFMELLVHCVVPSCFTL